MITLPVLPFVFAVAMMILAGYIVAEERFIGALVVAFAGALTYVLFYGAMAIGGVL
jgi:hypothetical protein